MLPTPSLRPVISTPRPIAPSRCGPGLDKEARSLAVAVLCDGRPVAAWARENGVSPGTARRRLALITEQLRGDLQGLV